RGHWPGALNIGLQGDFEPWTGALIAPGRAIVVHSLDEAGAQQAWTRLLRVGHERVPGWTSELPATPATQPQLEVSELAARLQTAGADWQVIDVRRPGEYAAGHVAGAAHAELSPAILQQPALQRLDRQRPTAVVCRGGYRSSAATHFLRAAGFRNLHNVLGGMSAWQGSELPVER
ncbi:MAG TPA: rhodanese-like domain-containing protein, partial [Planctomycetota bacterium]|nr:rhodanese-like domain-containing protein [Planctomycetota bacterium]